MDQNPSRLRIITRSDVESLCQAKLQLNQVVLWFGLAFDKIVSQTFFYLSQTHNMVAGNLSKSI